MQRMQSQLAIDAEFQLPKAGQKRHNRPRTPTTKRITKKPGTQITKTVRKPPSPEQEPSPPEKEASPPLEYRGHPSWNTGDLPDTNPFNHQLLLLHEIAPRLSLEQLLYAVDRCNGSIYQVARVLAGLAPTKELWTPEQDALLLNNQLALLRHQKDALAILERVDLLTVSYPNT
jgi:hypothetical protein